MAQLYLLSVVANIVAGLTLSADYLGERMPFLAGWTKLRESRSAAVTIGLVTAIVGVLKLIVRSPGERVPVVGDLLPALGGIALGLILLGESFRKGASTPETGVDKVTSVVLTYRVPVGIAGIIVGVLHFLLPGVLFI
jgi:hypothetical protein